MKSKTFLTYRIGKERTERDLEGLKFLDVTVAYMHTVDPAEYLRQAARYKDDSLLYAKERVNMDNGVLRVTYHETIVVTAEPERIRLNTGGYYTSTTKTRMNQASA